MIDQGAMARFRFGGGASETILNPLTIVLMAIAIVLILCRPRDRAISPFIVCYFTLPVGQVLVLGGLHFTVLQILILTVLIRMAFYRGSSSKRLFGGGFNRLDAVVVLWAFLQLIAFVLQWQETTALIKASGDLVVQLGGYLAVRFLLPDWEALQRVVKSLAIVCLIQGLCMTSELFTYYNLFTSIGGASPTIREGHVRAEGSMGGLYAGAFAGILMPLFIWLWMKGKGRLVAGMGMLGATAIIVASHASTAWLALSGSVIGVGFWPLRNQMRLVRCGLVGMLVSLHFVMHGPVWSLIEHIDLTGGSSSYHRYMLVDNCIRHFSDWWLMGYRYYGNWGFDMWDLCNQFVVAALTGGVFTLASYIAIYSRGFAAIGRARRREADHRHEWLLWCLGASLFGSVVASFGINYMYHLMLCFFILLACISAAVCGPSRDLPLAVDLPLEDWNRLRPAPAVLS